MFYLLNFRRKKTVLAFLGCLLCIALAVLLVMLIKDNNETERQEQDRLSQLNEELRGTFDEDDSKKDESNAIF